MKLFLIHLAALVATATSHEEPQRSFLRVASNRAGMGNDGMQCISNGGLRDRRLSPDQVCARDFAIMGGKSRVAYLCTSGARMACCLPDTPQHTEQPVQNLGTCTRCSAKDISDCKRDMTDNLDDVSEDVNTVEISEGPDATEVSDMNDMDYDDFESLLWTTVTGNNNSCTHNCKCQTGSCDLPNCTSNCKCQNGNCKMDKCTKNCKCQRGGCSMKNCKTQCKCQGGKCDMGEEVLDDEATLLRGSDVEQADFSEDADVTGVSEDTDATESYDIDDAEDEDDFETLLWSTKNNNSCTHNCKCQTGHCDLPQCSSNCKCQGGGCKMDKCTKNCKCQSGGCSMKKCKKQCKCQGGKCKTGEDAEDVDAIEVA